MMSERFETYGASQVAVSWLKPLTEVGDDTIPPGNYGIAIGSSSGNIAVFSGTAKEIIALGKVIGEAVTHIQEDNAVPLTMDSYRVTERGHPVCPRCGTEFNPAAHSSFGELLAEMREHIVEHAMDL